MRYLAIALIALLAVCGLGFSVYAHAQTGTATFTVDSKERGSGSGDHKTASLVFTDGETFTVADSIMDGTFSSSDTYGHLKVGHKYTCKTRGMRFPLFSMWRNLVRCEEV